MYIGFGFVKNVIIFLLTKILGRMRIKVWVTIVRCTHVEKDNAVRATLNHTALPRDKGGANANDTLW